MASHRQYRLYLLTESGGIHRAITLDCKSDDEAREIAAARRHQYGKELWERERLVSRYGDQASRAS